MKFQLAINLERLDPTENMADVARHTLEMVQLADEYGFELAWAAEHHALEMTIAPNPFQLLTWWADHTDNIRLGSGVANAAYWHPINLAGEAAMLDLISGGRLELGLGSGAYQREFDRMKPGLQQKNSYRYMQEMLPLVRELWNGDVEHKGEFWSFPQSTSCPKPLQKNVPFWVAARSPITFDYAVNNDCNILSWPLTKGMEEVELYMKRLETAVHASDGNRRPKIAMMRHTAVFEKEEAADYAINSVRRQMSQFANLFQNLDEVRNGFAAESDIDSLENRNDYTPETLRQNLMFGKPEEVISKLELYQDRGVDAFIYYASMGLDMNFQKQSLELFCKEVMPAL